MKKFIIIISLAAIAKFSIAQQLQKGNLIGIITISVTLKPGATMEQFEDFYSSKYIPALEHAFKEFKGSFIKSRRGEHANKYGILWIVKTEQDRDQYFNSDGKLNEVGKAAMAKIADVEKELEKIATTSSVFTDWIVQ